MFTMRRLGWGKLGFGVFLSLPLNYDALQYLWYTWVYKALQAPNHRDKMDIKVV